MKSVSYICSATEVGGELDDGRESYMRIRVVRMAINHASRYNSLVDGQTSVGDGTARRPKNKMAKIMIRVWTLDIPEVLYRVGINNNKTCK